MNDQLKEKIIEIHEHPKSETELDEMLVDLIEELRLDSPKDAKVQILMGQLKIPFDPDPVQQMLSTLNYANSFCKTLTKKKLKKKAQYEPNI